MSNGLIAFFIAAGGATWVYGKTSRSTGNNVRSSAIVAGMAALFLFILALLLLSLIPKA